MRTGYKNLIVLFIMVTAYLYFGTVECFAGNEGTIQGTDVIVRSEAVSGTELCTLNSGYPVTFVGIVYPAESEDGCTWYLVSFKKKGESVTKGWIRSDFIKWPSGDPENLSGAEAFIRLSGVKVMDEPGSGLELCTLSKGTSVTITATGGSYAFESANGYWWYYITFPDINGFTKGYIRSDYITFSDGFKESLEAQGFPDSYIAPLMQLHEDYPNWKFEAINVGYSWNSVLTTECAATVNMVPSSYGDEWKASSTAATGADDFQTETATILATGGLASTWVDASDKAIAYYLDPRNFLSAVNVFQFETLERADFQTESGVKSMLATTFMSGGYGESKSYARTFMDAADAYGVSPYHLAARCWQEQGAGTSPLISGEVQGYEGFYNYFNVGAKVGNPTVTGLQYAMGTDEAYLRPWNTRYKSILGGSKYLAEKYVKNSYYTPNNRYTQNTLYFQKFNILEKDGKVNAVHQYMQNVEAAYYEAVKIRKAHTSADLTSGALIFKIPVYGAMPAANCPRPE